MSDVLNSLSDSIRASADAVGPAVVGLGRAWGTGSGVVVAEGRILTTARNLRGDEATVSFADGRRAAGRVAGVDAALDLAAVEADPAGVPPVGWEPRRPASAAVGTPVFAL